MSAIYETVKQLRQQGNLPETIVIFGKSREIHWTEGAKLDNLSRWRNDKCSLADLARGGIVQIPPNEWPVHCGVHDEPKSDPQDSAAAVVRAAGLELYLSCWTGELAFHYVVPINLRTQ